MIKCALRLKSGTYHVRASELACIHKRKLQMIKVDVRFPDETVQSFDLPKNANGCDLFERVVDHLDLVNCEYFGLQYEKRISTSTVFTWLNMHKCVKKQLANAVDPKLFYFKVKFYATDPSDLQFEEFTRYQFYLQIRNDIFNERLILPNSIACLLGSYIAQSELGDYSEQNQEINYLAKLKILPNQTEDFERKVAELHKLHKGQNPADAECNFLEHAKRLEMYGVELFSVKDSSMKSIQLGITAYGLLVFQNSIRINTFSWSKILKISYKKKQFFIQLKRENNEEFDMLLGFNLESYQEAKLLWKTCVEHHTFYRVPTPIVETKRIEMFWRKSKWFSFWKSVSANKEPTTTANRLNLFFCKRSSSSAAKVLSETSATTALPIKQSNSSDSNSNSNSNFQTRKSLSPIPPKKSRRRYINKKKLVLNIPNSHNSTVVDQHPVQTACSPNFYKIHQENKISSTAENKPKQAWNDDDNATMSQRFGAIATNALSGSSALVEGKSEEFSKPFSPILIGHGLSYVDDDPLNTPIDESTSIFSVSPAKVFSVRLKADSNGRFGFNVISSNANGNETFDDDIGSAQQQSPLCGPKKSISISRIAPNTSADKCSPKLSEGDRILLINGFDVRNGVTQERVIEIIRTAMFRNDGVLELVIEPSAGHSSYSVGIRSDDNNDNNGHDDDAASFQYILEKSGDFILDHAQNDNNSNSNNRNSSCDRLNQSMFLLANGLSSGTIVRQFELLQKRHPNMNYSVALEYDNLAKNRYRDILPYDETRVVLNENPRGGDFINANHISIEIDATNWRASTTVLESAKIKLTTATTNATETLAPQTTIHNRYIATQGPLQSTCDDFWQMVLENNVRLIVMLTTVIEKGRPKCHKYWPSFNETVQTPSMQIECETEDTDTSENFICRTFVISDLMTSKKRTVQHIQYVTWPDHDVPDSSCAFLEFTQKMRSIRNECPSSPVVVHCSAGIGRTGALILMETAICLIEANEPVYPLDIVQEMRRQRAMMIQNSSQYSFVCETIYTAFSQGLLKPLLRS